MKFEEVLHALLEGKKIRRKCWSESNYIYSRKGESSFRQQDDYAYIFGVNEFKADDWEIVKEKKKIKLRDLTSDQYRKWRNENCKKYDCCKGCPFQKVNCYNDYKANDGWYLNKYLYSDKFLNQEIEIED